MTEWAIATVYNNNRKFPIYLWLFVHQNLTLTLCSSKTISWQSDWQVRFYNDNKCFRCIVDFVYIWNLRWICDIVRDHFMTKWGTLTVLQPQSTFFLHCQLCVHWNLALTLWSPKNIKALISLSKTVKKNTRQNNRI